MIHQFSNVQDPQIQRDVIAALGFKGNALGRLHRYEEATAMYKEIIRRFGDSQDIKI